MEKQKEKMERRRSHRNSPCCEWCDELLCQVLQPVFVASVLVSEGCSSNRPRSNVGIVAGHSQEKEKHPPPPFLRSMLESIVANHLIKQIDAFHVLLVVSEGSWHYHLDLVGSVSSAIHCPRLSWIVMVGQHHDGFRVLPNTEREFALLSYPELVLSH